AAREGRSVLARMRHGEPLAALGATALEHLTPVLGRHAYQEAMGLLPALAVRLKCAFTLHDCAGTSAAILAKRRNSNSSGPLPEVSIAARKPPMLQSGPRCLPEGVRRVSPRSFPQLWKKMWKSPGAKVRKTL